MLYLTGREKDIIIRGGRNISPYELEEAIGDLEGVRRGCVAVFGSVDRASGHREVVVLAETREKDPAQHARTAHADQRPRTRHIGMPSTTSCSHRRNRCRRPRAARSGASRAASTTSAARARSNRRRCGWQFVRLVWSGVVPQLRRGLRVLAGFGFAARVWAAFGLVIPVVFASALLAPVPPSPGALGHRLRAPVLPPRRAAAWARADSINARRTRPQYWWSTTPATSTRSCCSRCSTGRPRLRRQARIPRQFLMRTLLAGFGTQFVERIDVRQSAEHASTWSRSPRAAPR